MSIVYGNGPVELEDGAIILDVVALKSKRGVAFAGTRIRLSAAAAQTLAQQLLVAVDDTVSGRHKRRINTYRMEGP